MTIKEPSRQLPLLTVDPLLTADSNASARNAYGMAAQIIVCERLALDPIPIDGRYDICFDAKKDGVYYEIKSVHKSGKLVIYDWRLEKELNSGVPCFYAILVHDIRGARNDVLNMMRQHVVRIMVVPVQAISHAATGCPLNFPKPSNKKRNGYNRKGYLRGYRNIPVQRILQGIST